MALAHPKCSGLMVLDAPASSSGRMMDPPPTRMTSLSSLETFMASTASSAMVLITDMAFSASSRGMLSTREGSPTLAFPVLTATSVAVITSPPNTIALLVIS